MIALAQGGVGKRRRWLAMRARAGAVAGREIERVNFADDDREERLGAALRRRVQARRQQFAEVRGAGPASPEKNSVPGRNREALRCGSGLQAAARRRCESRVCDHARRGRAPRDAPREGEPGKANRRGLRRRHGTSPKRKRSERAAFPHRQKPLENFTCKALFNYITYYPFALQKPAEMTGVKCDTK